MNVQKIELTQNELKNFIMDLLEHGYIINISLIKVDADDDMEKTIREYTIVIDEHYIHTHNILYLLEKGFGYDAPEFYIKINLKDDEVKP